MEDRYGNGNPADFDGTSMENPDPYAPTDRKVDRLVAGNVGPLVAADFGGVVRVIDHPNVKGDELLARAVLGNGGAANG